MTKFLQKYPFAVWSLGFITAYLLIKLEAPWYISCAVGAVSGWFIPPPNK